MIGEELRKQRRYEGAAEFYSKALAQDSTKLVYYVRLGGTLILLKQPDKAFDLLQRAAQTFPEKPEANYFLGVAARGRGAYDVAEVALRKSLALQPDNVDTLAQLGFIVGERGNFAEAEKFLRRAIVLSAKHFMLTMI
jgi:tetratricopeptide (TPR) repeat protein